MSRTSTLRRLQRAGVDVKVVGAGLRITPASALSDDLRAAVRRDQARLVLALTPSRPCGSGPRPAKHAPAEGWRSCECCGLWTRRASCRECARRSCIVRRPCQYCGYRFGCLVWEQVRNCSQCSSTTRRGAA
jgi:hypothetical protein